MKTRKLDVVLLALLLAAMAMVPIVSAQNNTTDINSVNHLTIHLENKNVTNVIAYDITSKTNLSSYNIQKPEELLIPGSVTKFDVATFDHTLFNNQLKSGKEITISLGGKDYQAEIPRMNFENISDGVDSYHGSLSGEKNSDILITTGEKVFIARITLENETLWIIPVEPRERMELNQSPLHIIYNSKDLMHTEFTIDNGTVKINPELSPSVHQSKLSILQQTPQDQNVTVDILVVTDNIFYNNSYWIVPAQNIIAEANRVFSKNDIKVILRPQYDDSRRTIFSSDPRRTSYPNNVLKDIYPTSDLDSVGADIVIYLGGYDIPWPNEYWNSQGLSWGFNTSSEFSELRRYSWAQMVDDFPGYTANPHGQQSISIHEIGHLFGAHHNDVPDEPQYARAATFGNVPYDKKTVMWTEYSDTASLTEFSSDDCLYQVFYPWGSQWYPMGDTNHDNSRRISETRDIVADYTRFPEIGVFRPSTHTFYLRNAGYPSVPPTTIDWGISTDLPVTGDWDGNGLTDVGVFRPSTHIFYLKNGTTTAVNWGISTDLPVTGDWDGDGLANVGVFRPSTHTFYLKNGTTTAVNWGISTDLPVTGDWDGDGMTEVGVFRPSNHTFYLRNTGYPGVPATAINWGLSTDLPVTGDWDGDGMTEVGVFSPSTHTFSLRHAGYPLVPNTTIDWGASTDLPVTGTWS